MDSKMYPLLGIIAQNGARFTVQFNDHEKNGLKYSGCAHISYDPIIFQEQREYFGLDFPVVDWSATTFDDAFYFALYHSLDPPTLEASQDLLKEISTHTNAAVISIDEVNQKFNIKIN